MENPIKLSINGVNHDLHPFQENEPPEEYEVNCCRKCGQFPSYKEEFFHPSLKIKHYKNLICKCGNILETRNSSFEALIEAWNEQNPIGEIHG